MPGDVPEGEAWRFGTFKDPKITQEVKFSGERRRCKHCLIYKPDRCHHCRICKSCILKMDHHCPWIMNCIGFRNHKYFFLLIIYSMLCCGFIGITVFETIVWSLEQEMPISHRFLLLLCFSTTSIMGGLLVMFAGFHTMLMLRGLTTIEFCEKMSIVTSGTCCKYDLGVYRNITAVFGPRPYLWLLPVDPPVGDGVIFGKQARHRADNDPEWLEP
ncbi:Palmitoyltransferase ZDHHC15 (Acyltransferase ZDHHC15) (Zinc finger DHHC domain-containing protein 15) (DHHC-15) [Durusdinium trenchii]|uniref:Palmitoyltransferase n=1 Tax=Durusdinium trenchii TaxID=1381693 RepID=A0ABP0SAW8_9DINO